MLNHAASHEGNIVRHFIDSISLGVALGALMHWLPAISALLSIVWTVIRIAETATFQRIKKRAWKRG